MRNAPGLSSEEYTIDARVGGETFEGLEIKVEAREYTEDELNDLLTSNHEAMMEKLLAGSDNTEKVAGDLNFYEKLDSLPFDFEWLPEDTELISDEGKILYPDPFDTAIRLNISYKSFSKDYSIPIHAQPGIEVQTRIKRNVIISTIETVLSENAMMTKPFAEMPGSVDGKKAEYYYSASKRNPVFILLGLVAVACLHVGFKKDKENSVKKRKDEIVRELPGILQKMTMYISSGMTFRNIWLLLCDKAQKTGDNHKPIYEEMTVSANELKSGISETVVYTRFGERTGTPETVRFTALVSQNIKTGSTRLSELLRAESGNAFTERKQRALKAGEEAGTKLLFPMMMLLGDMLAIIMIPAFMNI
ncbi:MAG: hypothetical protein K6E19_11095 [Lachnospiraceae bacterium]|nr:hypothetical protein [Lachnospiraceae bacterium]